MNENRAIEWLRPVFEHHRNAVEESVRVLLTTRAAADRGKIEELRRANALMLEALESVKESDNESYIDVGPHDNPRREYRCSFCGCGPHDDHDEACPIPVVGAAIEAARKAMPAGDVA